MKNIKKAFIIVMAAIIFCVVCTACKGAEVTDAENAATKVAEEESGSDIIIIDVGEMINEVDGGKPVVRIYCHDKDVAMVVDLSEINNSEVIIEMETEFEADDYFYVTMAGNVTDHTLESDGALFDGTVGIDENGEARFSVTYDNVRTVEFCLTNLLPK